MKRINVYLQKPWRFAEDSPYYISLKNNPPKNIHFIQPKEFDFIHKKNKFRYTNLLKNIGRKLIKTLNESMPNRIRTKDTDGADLIHCERCLSKNNLPFVCDIEYVGQLWKSGSPREREKDKILRYLESKNCKKIMPWTNWCAEDIISRFPSIKNKIEVVYPAIESRSPSRIDNKNTINLLFVARRFYLKGGLYAVEVINRITKKYKNVRGIVIAEIPEEILSKYGSNKKITFSPMIPRKELFEKIYPKSDILVYPGFIDSFGFPIIEAMRFGVPIVSVMGSTRKEIISEGKTGFVVGPENIIFSKEYMENLKDEKIINEMCEKTEHLINNKKILKEMSKDCVREIKTGKFSIRERNKKLAKIYSDAIN